MNGPELYRSALGKVQASESWKQRTRAAMEAAAAGEERPRLTVAKSPRRAWKVALVAACLVLAAIPVLRYGPMLGLDVLGSVGGAVANDQAAPEMAMAAGGTEPAEAASPRLYSSQEAPAAVDGQLADVTEDKAENPPVALEGLPGPGEAADAVLTRVGEDETSVYYLAGGLEGVTAVYADGSTEPLADALEAGRVTLADLEALGVELIVEPR